eukprot:6208236-Pleurochrysis_carterae.AAC.5
MQPAWSPRKRRCNGGVRNSELTPTTELISARRAEKPSTPGTATCSCGPSRMALSRNCPPTTSSSRDPGRSSMIAILCAT